MLKLLAISILLLSTHLGCFYSGDKFASIWFILNALGIYILTFKNTNIFWINDIAKGYSLGYLIEVIRCHYFGYEESHIGEILLFVFLIVGFFWRKYKEHTITAAMITGVTSAFKWIVTKILTVIFTQ